MKKETLIIFDTTLRDGEQSPGAGMTRDEKLRIARQLERVKVDVIEAGFAAASPGDFAAVSAIAGAITDCTVCSLARANERDVRAAGEALKAAKRARIHTFIATSPIHMQRKLNMTEEQVINAAVQSIRIAREYTQDVEFSAEDAVRSEFDFLCRVFAAAIEAGATTLNVPDTVGYSIPFAWGQRIRDLIARVPGAERVTWSTHCHNDLGLASANSLAAVLAGARQVECTINGLGERAGNAALEEVVMAVRTRGDIFGCDCRVDATQIVPASRLVSQITGYPVQPNKAIVGANAFAHASGIHQDGVLKWRQTYEIMRAEDVGWGANKLVLGKLSGRAAFKQRLSDLRIELSGEDKLNEAFARFKTLADKKSEIFDEDIIALTLEGEREEAESYQLEALHQSSGMGQPPKARVTYRFGGQSFSGESSGNGPVDASLKAIEVHAQSGAEMLLYSINAISGSTESQGEVTIRLQQGGRMVNGVGSDADIVVASAKAYLAALSKLQRPERLDAQKEHTL